MKLDFALEVANYPKSSPKSQNVWLSASRLRLNASKMQLMWLGSTQLLDKITCQDVLVLGTCVAFSDTARNLGVVTDSELSLAVHVSTVCRSSYSKLRQLWPVVTPCPCMPSRCWSRHSSHAAWITATHCCMASTTAYCTAYSQCRTRLRAW